MLLFIRRYALLTYAHAFRLFFWFFSRRFSSRQMLRYFHWLCHFIIVARLIISLIISMPPCWCRCWLFLFRFIIFLYYFAYFRFDWCWLLFISLIFFRRFTLPFISSPCWLLSLMPPFRHAFAFDIFWYAFSFLFILMPPALALIEYNILHGISSFSLFRHCCWCRDAVSPLIYSFHFELTSSPMIISFRPDAFADCRFRTCYALFVCCPPLPPLCFHYALSRCRAAIAAILFAAMPLPCHDTPYDSSLMLIIDYFRYFYADAALMLPLYFRWWCIFILITAYAYWLFLLLASDFASSFSAAAITPPYAMSLSLWLMLSDLWYFVSSIIFFDFWCFFIFAFWYFLYFSSCYAPRMLLLAAGATRERERWCWRFRFSRQRHVSRWWFFIFAFAAAA